MCAATFRTARGESDRTLDLGDCITCVVVRIVIVVVVVVVAVVFRVVVILRVVVLERGRDSSP